MKNPLHNFTLMDVADMKERALAEVVNKQATYILDTMYEFLKTNPDAKYMPYSTHFNINPDLIHMQNLRYLYDNGFRVCRISASMQNKTLAYKYFICWAVDHFEEVMKNEMKDETSFTEFELIELVPSM